MSAPPPTDAPAPRLAVVLSHPTQYYCPWFRRLARSGAVDLRVFFLWDFGVKRRRDDGFHTAFVWDRDLLSGYASEFVPNRATRPATDRFFGLVNPGIGRALRRFRPDALLLFGYNYCTHLGVIAWCRLAGVPLLFRGDSHLLGPGGNPSGLKRRLLRRLYARFQAVTYVGRANRAYFEALGVPPEKLFFAPHAVDPDLFDPNDFVHLKRAAHLRAELEIPDDSLVVLFAGKFNRQKQPLLLLEAFERLAPAKAVLVFSGDGELRAELTERGRRSPHLRFLPFANQTEMPARYLLGDLFVLPSLGRYETWGLAVNEAMQMGRPCLVSDHVGCHPDLVADGTTGWIFPAGDAEALRQKLGEALRLLRADPEPFRQAARARVASYSYQAATNGLGAALRAAVNG